MRGIKLKQCLSRLASLGVLLVIAVLILLFNASIPGREVQGCLQGCASADEKPAHSLRILSLNVLHGHPDFEKLPDRLDLIAAGIRHLEVDIALLQEVPACRELTCPIQSGAAYLGGRTGMNYAYLRANGNRGLIGFEEGEVVLSRFPLVFVELRELEPVAGFFENRVVLHAVTQAASQPLDLYVTHLTNAAVQVNQGQAEALFAYVSRTAQHTAIVAGDFNALENSQQMRSLSQNWIDAYRSANSQLPGFTCCIDDLRAGQAELTQRIDYLFVAPAVGEHMEIVRSLVVLDQPHRLGEAWL